MLALCQGAGLTLWHTADKLMLACNARDRMVAQTYDQTRELYLIYHGKLCSFSPLSLPEYEPDPIQEYMANKSLYIHFTKREHTWLGNTQNE